MNVKSEIREAFVENKKIFAALALLFILGFAIAWIVADDIALVLMPLLKQALLEDNANSIDALSILSHNLRSAVMTYVLSIFLGLIAVISIFTNGFAIGFLGGFTVKSVNDLILFMVLIVPHGILEIPALFCNCASGLLLFIFLLKTLDDKAHNYSLKEAYYNNQSKLKHSLILLLIALILFIIAAFIEGFITPELGNMVNMHLTGQTLF